MPSIAVTRELNAAIGDCELTFLPRSSIDFARAQQQHQDYQTALASLGCEVVVVPAPGARGRAASHDLVNSHAVP